MCPDLHIQKLMGWPSYHLGERRNGKLIASNLSQWKEPDAVTNLFHPDRKQAAAPRGGDLRILRVSVGLSYTERQR